MHNSDGHSFQNLVQKEILQKNSGGGGGGGAKIVYPEFAIFVILNLSFHISIRIIFFNI